ncbi:MAG: DUF2442 domain-containing protein [Chloroflexi bacterium]|nr:DUF2442 domain-containing protein [Chloroflexota bacterium]
MSTSPVRATPVLASDVWFDYEMLHVRLADGRELSVPLEWYPRLRNANPEQRANWRLIGRGAGIHWEDVDEDLSVAGLPSC